MFEISEKAVSKAKEILSAEGKSDWGLRIYKAGGSCCGPSYGLDIEEKSSSSDDVLERDGLKVFIDKDVTPGLDSMILDYYEDEEREGFIMTGRMPSCGSGTPSCNPGACGSSC
ncbi:MAG TPA: iron-sulfur cluster assembly accessory protein [Nitrospirae bacterium]|nr:iron-sulfur cluster assembly accessory protein [Nitrospirota bacterium]